MLAPVYRNILLWRHADALPLDTQILQDFDRPLSKKGHNQAFKIAHWLKGNLPNNTMLISSAALRAKQTAQALSNDFIVYDSLAPSVSLSKVVQTINDLSTNYQTDLDLIVVGHQPWLGELASYLFNVNRSLPIEEINIKKGAVWWFKRASKLPNRTYSLYCLQTPSLL